MKYKIIATIALLAIVGIGGYVVFTLNSGEQLNEASPLETGSGGSVGTPSIKDNLDSMDDATRADFEREVETMRAVITEGEEAMPQGARLLATGDFMRRFHSVAGQALLIQDDAKKILRFENFETDNGPNLHIYLASDLSDDDFIDLGKIKATKGNINYEVPAEIDTEKYNKVLVWCVPFNVLFSYAELN